MLKCRTQLQLLTLGGTYPAGQAGRRRDGACRRGRRRTSAKEGDATRLLPARTAHALEGGGEGAEGGGRYRGRGPFWQGEAFGIVRASVQAVQARRVVRLKGYSSKGG